MACKQAKSLGTDFNVIKPENVQYDKEGDTMGIHGPDYRRINRGVHNVSKVDIKKIVDPVTKSTNTRLITDFVKWKTNKRMEGEGVERKSGTFDKSVSLISENIISQTAQHLAVKGGVETQSKIIETVSEELCDFLTQYKGKYITKEQLESFYKEVFPELKVVIDGSKPKKNFFGKIPKAVTFTPYEDGVYKGSITIQLYSESPNGKLFRGENEEKFYVSPDFVESFIHENIHIMQIYMKPVDKVYQDILKKIAETRYLENADSWYMGCVMDRAIAYNMIVYKKEHAEEESISFDEERFIERVKKAINQYCATEDVKLAHLKQFIRYTEGEKQAHELGILNKLRFEYPDLAENNYYDGLFRKFAAEKADAFKFESKIKAMKKEYFRIIEEERSKIESHGENNESSVS